MKSENQKLDEVLKELDDDKYIIKASSGPRYVVNVRTKLDKKKI